MIEQVLTNSSFVIGSIIVGLAIIAVVSVLIANSKILSATLVTSTSKAALDALANYVANSEVTNKTFLEQALVIVDHGVKAAEQLYKQDNQVNRSEVALNFIYDALDESGIDLTDTKKKLIKELMLSAVHSLPKTKK